MPATNNVSKLSNQELVAAKKACTKVDQVTLKIAGKTITFDCVEAFVRKGPSGMMFVTLPTIHAVTQNGNPLTEPTEVRAALRVLRQKTQSKVQKVIEVPGELRKQLEAFSRANNVRIAADTTKFRRFGEDGSSRLQPKEIFTW